jgi:hypothetical protein
MLAEGASPARLLWELQNLYKRAFTDGVAYASDNSVVATATTIGAFVSSPIDRGADMPDGVDEP